ncbi:RNA polymerase sporulation sigma factor SigK [Paenibacillus phytohabitans]
MNSKSQQSSDSPIIGGSLLYIFGYLLLASAGYGQSKVNDFKHHFWHAAEQKVPDRPVILQLSKYTLWLYYPADRQSIVLEENKKIDNTGEDMEDLISIGTIGLIKAIESYRPNKGTKLATFAARCIENEILMHLRSLKKTRKDVSLHDPIGTDKEGNEITLIDILGSEADDVIKEVDLKIEKSKIYRNLDILDEREKEVVVGRFGLDTGGEERTQREIAKDLGISRSYVSRIEKRALMKLYHEFYKAKR